MNLFYLLTGISQKEYRDAVPADANIIWFCPFCPVAESTRLIESV